MVQWSGVTFSICISVLRMLGLRLNSSVGHVGLPVRNAKNKQTETLPWEIHQQLLIEKLSLLFRSSLCGLWQLAFLLYQHWKTLQTFWKFRFWDLENTRYFLCGSAQLYLVYWDLFLFLVVG